MPRRVWFSLAVGAAAVAWWIFVETSGIVSTRIAAKDAATSKVSASPYPAKKFDPIAKNGPIFTGWTKPEFALLLSGLQDGYLEPCGCAGIDNQKGGMARRYTLIKQLKEKGWPLVPLDVGNQVKRFGRQAEIKFGIAAEAFGTMGYDAVGLGIDDLRLPPNELLAATANLTDNDGVSRFVSANVGLLGFEAQATPRFRRIEIAGHRIAVTSVLADSLAKTVKGDEIEVAPAAQALAQAVPLMKKEADILVLLCYGTNEEAVALVKKFPDFQVVATAGGADEPPAQAALVPGTKCLLIDVGHKGMYAIVLGYYDDLKKPWRYQRVPLDSRFPDSPEMKQLMAGYQGQLQQEGFSGLGIQPVPYRGANGSASGGFAGAASCKECHPTGYGIWSKSKHAHATESLTKLDPPRQFDPECVSCHSTGWDPQQYVPYQGGFLGVDETPLLTGNSCENCHGPAADHVAAEEAKGPKRNVVQREKLRQSLRLTKATIESTCAKCHDHDNSPEFDFQKYWPKIEHHGKK